jgi:hypothetical protein
VSEERSERVRARSKADPAQSIAEVVVTHHTTPGRGE